MDSSKKNYNWGVRAAGLFLLAATAWYLPWALWNINWGVFWISVPFALSILLAAVMMVIAVVNNWREEIPTPHPAPPGQEADVAVIIPTYGEPPWMVYKTARSVLDQDYPVARIHLFVSDDGHRRNIREMVESLKRDFPGVDISYFEPPRRGDPARRGEAKAGNLSAVLDHVNRRLAPIQFVETRDADDVVGDESFLRQAVGQLLLDPKVAFVQTIKEAEVSPGDPFGNLEPLFYRKLMLHKNAADAVFPCGSGLVWRLQALNDIGGFPYWNLVEDLQSGLEALRRGWRGMYLPIVGAIGQTAPEDIPNMIKQRGTWAIDTVRLALWGDKKGLNLFQRLHFLEMGLFYTLGFTILVFIVSPIFPLAFGVHPLTGTQLDYAIHLWPYVVAIELFLVALAEGLPYEKLWRARQILLGMAPVYAWAAIVALRYGPTHKPGYRVTRKEHVFGWYWREIWIQLFLLLALIAASLYHVATHSLLKTADLGSLFWAAFFILGLSRVVRNSWHGLNWSHKLAELQQSMWRKFRIRQRV